MKRCPQCHYKPPIKLTVVDVKQEAISKNWLDYIQLIELNAELTLLTSKYEARKRLRTFILTSITGGQLATILVFMLGRYFG